MGNNKRALGCRSICRLRCWLRSCTRYQSSHISRNSTNDAPLTILAFASCFQLPRQPERTTLLQLGSPWPPPCHVPGSAERTGQGTCLIRLVGLHYASISVRPLSASHRWTNTVTLDRWARRRRASGQGEGINLLGWSLCGAVSHCQPGIVRKREKAREMCHVSGSVVNREVGWLRYGRLTM